MGDAPTLSEREQKLAKAYKRKRELPDDPEDARLVAGLITGGVLPLEKSAQSSDDDTSSDDTSSDDTSSDDTPDDQPDTK